KLAVVFEHEALYEPAGSTPSTHILKPDHPDEDYPHSVINEWFIMRLAKRLGLEVPAVHRRYVPSPVYIIDRFDRVKSEAGWERRHVIDACQLLGLDRSFKYAQGSVERLAELAKACRSPAVARIRLFSWLIFNMLVGNTDAHLKNLSFLVSPEGIQLAPHYDLLSTATYETRAYDQQGWPLHTRLAWPVLGVQHFSDLNKTLLLDAGQALHLSKNTAHRLLTSLSSRIVQEATMLYHDIENENTLILRRRPELTATLSGELRCLRTVIYTIIKEIVRQVS
ncbi:MAG: type II toxin-antitoxin system HipA family toxin, partial [Alcaligenaceae bacterium]|nr:type II toxin-antitoxin system HipA family toxin [Alcaligenaceae bacterium]